jgi:ATP-dependent DNA helicase RecQ
LRELRKRLADERAVPAYVIFGDATLREMARRYPSTREAMRGIFGVGERKLEEYGAVFAAVVAGHLESYPRVEFAARD